MTMLKFNEEKNKENIEKYRKEFEEKEKEKRKIAFENTIEIVKGYKRYIEEKKDLSQTDKDYIFWADEDYLLKIETDIIFKCGIYPDSYFSIYKENKNSKILWFKSKKLLFKFNKFEKLRRRGKFDFTDMFSYFDIPFTKVYDPKKEEDSCIGWA